MGLKIGDKVVYYHKALLGCRDGWKWFSSNEGEIIGMSKGAHNKRGIIVKWENAKSRFFDGVSEFERDGDTIKVGIGEGLLFKKQDLILELL